MRKTSSTSILLIAGAFLTATAAAEAGSQIRVPPAPSQLPAPPPVPQEPRPPATPAEAQRKRFEPYLTVTSGFDSNIEHDRRGADSWGGVLGAGLVFRSDPVDPAFELNAEVAGHSWTNSSRWDRFSQKVTASYEHDLPGRWGFDTTGEVSQKGSSEDRELTDQYVIIPRLAYRISPQNRVRVYVGLRARRYDQDPGRNAFNRYIGVEFTERAAPERRWELDLRYEVNDTDNPRNHYNRWTVGTTYSFPIAPHRIEAELRYRQQYYPFRLVEVDDTDVNRRDHRWIPKVFWIFPLDANLDVRTGYTFETRTSNDLDREFTAHLLTVTLVRRW